MQTWLQEDHIRPYARLFYRIVLTILGFFIITRILPMFFSFFLPFVLAFLVAAAMNPLICLLQRKWKASRSILSVLMVVLALLIVAAIVGGFIYAIGREVVALAQNIDAILEYFGQTIQVMSLHLYWLLDYMPADTEEVLSGIMDGLMVWVQAQGTAFADVIVTSTANTAARVGGGVVSLVIFIMASYFIMADFPKITERLKNLLSRRLYNGYSTLRDVTLSALGGYLKAQALMAFVIFCFSLAALLIIGQEFAILLALLFGFMDLLPIVGTSIVLVPWGIINLIAGEIGRGIYLLAMSFFAFLIRRMIEPKVVGSQMGLSPLAALASIYIGMQLGGVLGLILGPIVAMVIVSLYKAGLFNGWIKDVNAVIYLLRQKFSDPQ